MIVLLAPLGCTAMILLAAGGFVAVVSSVAAGMMMAPIALVGRAIWRRLPVGEQQPAPGEPAEPQPRWWAQFERDFRAYVTEHERASPHDDPRET